MEWQLYVQRWRDNSNYAPSVVSYLQGTASTARSGTPSISGISSITGGYKQQLGGAYQSRNRGAADIDTQKVQNKFREEHPDRYRPEAVNPEVESQIKKIMKDIGEVEFPLIEGAVGKSWWQMKQCESVEEGVYPAYATGTCTFRECRARHLLGRETPRG